MKLSFKNIFLGVVFMCFSATVASQSRVAISHGPYIQGLTEDEVTIVWTTDKDAVSWVELAPDDGTHFYNEERDRIYAVEYGFKKIDSVHFVKVTNLEPNTTYRYRIYSQEVVNNFPYNVTYGRVAASNVYDQAPLKFTTSNPNKENVSVLVLNDIHGRNDLMESLLKGADWDNTDLVIFNGDMASDIRGQKKLFDDFVDKAISIFAKETPFYYARGNHETRGNYAITFPKYFPTPTGQLYYTFRQGPVYFVVLDCGEDKPDTDIEYSGAVAFDDYRTEQALWLEEVVKTDDFKNAPFRVVVTHIPPADGWHGEKEILEKFVPILNNADIDVMLTGHLHRHIYREANNKVKFPVLVNSNEEMIKLDANYSGINLSILNTEGKEIKSFNFKK